MNDGFTRSFRPHAGSARTFAVGQNVRGTGTEVNLGSMSRTTTTNIDRTRSPGTERAPEIRQNRDATGGRVVVRKTSLCREKHARAPPPRSCLVRWPGALFQLLINFMPVFKITASILCFVRYFFIVKFPLNIFWYRSVNIRCGELFLRQVLNFIKVLKIVHVPPPQKKNNCIFYG